MRLELRSLDLELRKNEVPKKLELRSFEVPIFNFRKVTIPSQKLRMFELFAGNFFLELRMFEVPTFLELRMLENTMKVESFEVPKSSELRKKILELRSLNLELRNFEVPTPCARHCSEATTGYGRKINRTRPYLVGTQAEAVGRLSHRT